jgi:hypothetical protein
VRIAYLIAGIILAIIELFNGPRLFWIEHEAIEPIGLFRGFQHGLIGFSYMVSWSLIVAGVYQILLGILYWDMDTSERKRWQFTLESLGTARLLWIVGGLCLVLGISYVVWVYGNDNYVWPCGLASTLWALLTCWLFWLAFPLYAQSGIDRDEVRGLNI